MQTTTKQIKYQQAVLRLFGYYKGPIDGLWGGETIQAKKTFESKPDFAPAIPNNGLPFGDKSPLPRGCMMVKQCLTVIDKAAEVEQLVNPPQKEKASEETKDLVQEASPSTGDKEEQRRRVRN